MFFIDVMVKKNKKGYKAYLASQGSYGSKKHEDELLKKGYMVDKELSGEREKVYHHKKKKPIVAFRGTQDFTDLGADAGIVFGRYGGGQFGRADALVGKVKSKYGRVGTVTGHSLGGTKAIKVGAKHGAKVVAFNPGTGLWNLDAGKSVVYKTDNDFISRRVSGGVVKEVKGGHSLHHFEDQF